MAALISAGLFLLSLRATGSADASKIDFQIQAGEKFGSIVADLKTKNLISSSLSFEILALLEGKAGEFKPGDYELDAGLSGWNIIGILTAGGQKEVSVVIPEGSDLAEIDAILGEARILRSGALINYQNNILGGSSGQNLEGYLFPDTYNFFIGSNVDMVVGKFLSNFNQKALAALSQDKNNLKENLILASLIEKEAADYQSRVIIAGILKKRLENHMPLQIDATICYVKEQVLGIPYKNCYPIKTSDLKIQSPYNTYLNTGLPPAPISNPGLSAIEAAINPKSSPYWYYLSDPKTGKIIFAENYAEQQKNELKYLGR